MEEEQKFYVYLHASKPYGTIYTGSTGNPTERTYSHKFRHQPNAFTTKYNVNRLVYYEEHPTRTAAYTREKQLKHYLRNQKIALIEQENPHWQDLAAHWYKRQT